MGDGMGMTRLWPGVIAAALLGLIVAGCTGGTDAPPAVLQVLESGRRTIVERRAAGRQAERPPLTRAALDTVATSALEVTLERPDHFAYVFVQTERGDDHPGRIVVWRTEDNITLAMRNGMLIATRGLGGDLLSASVPAAGDRPGPALGGERVMQLRGLDNRRVSLALACARLDLGPETVTIVEIAHPARHLRETCTSPDGGSVVNDYWVDPQRRIVWQSRQWAGPAIGYIRTRRLTTG